MCKNKILKLQFTTLLGGIINSLMSARFPAAEKTRVPRPPDHPTLLPAPSKSRGVQRGGFFFVLRKKNSGNKNDILLGTKYIAVIILDGEPSWLI